MVKRGQKAWKSGQKDQIRVTWGGARWESGRKPLHQQCTFLKSMFDHILAKFDHAQGFPLLFDSILTMCFVCVAFCFVFTICVNKRIISLTFGISCACLRALETHLSCLHKRVCFILQVSRVVVVPSLVVEFQTAKFATLFSLLGLLFSLVITYFLLMYCNWRRSTIYIKSLESRVKNACLTTPNHSIKEIMLLNWVAKSLIQPKNIIRICIQNTLMILPFEGEGGGDL